MESTMLACIHNHGEAQNHYDSAKSGLKKTAPKAIFPAGYRNQAHPP
jgi:hypothetical protein